MRAILQMKYGQYFTRSPYSNGQYEDAFQHILGGNIKGRSSQGDQLMQYEGGHLESALPAGTKNIKYKDADGNLLVDNDGNPKKPDNDKPYRGNFVYERKIYDKEGEVIGSESFTKGGRHTFFPINWTPEQVVQAIIEAYGNRTVLSNGDVIGYYKKGTLEEFKIRLMIDPRNGKIHNAHPEL